MMAAPARQSFYDSALGEAERELAEARAVSGLDEEVALLRVLLRVLLRRALVDHADDVKLLQGGVRLLIQSLIAQHRLSEKQAENLSEAIVNVLDEFGEALKGAPDE